jgi:shikimate dehydrogenase
VNTVHVRDDRTVGYNTDGEGFLQPLHALHLPLTTTTTCMLGAGGAARAVAMALLEAGCPVLVLANRTYERAARLVAVLQGYFPQAQVRAVPLAEAADVARQSGLLINATSVGLHEAMRPCCLTPAFTLTRWFMISSIAPYIRHCCRRHSAVERRLCRASTC